MRVVAKGFYVLSECASALSYTFVFFGDCIFIGVDNAFYNYRENLSDIKKNVLYICKM